MLSFASESGCDRHEIPPSSHRIRARRSGSAVVVERGRERLRGPSTSGTGNARLRRKGTTPTHQLPRVVQLERDLAALPHLGDPIPRHIVDAHQVGDDHAVRPRPYARTPQDEPEHPQHEQNRREIRENRRPCPANDCIAHEQRREPHRDPERDHGRCCPEGAREHASNRSPHSANRAEAAMFLHRDRTRRRGNPPAPRRLAIDPKEGATAQQSSSEQSLHGDTEF